MVPLVEGPAPACPPDQPQRWAWYIVALVFVAVCEPPEEMKTLERRPHCRSQRTVGRSHGACWAWMVHDGAAVAAVDVAVAAAAGAIIDGDADGEQQGVAGASGMTDVAAAA